MALCFTEQCAAQRANNIICFGCFSIQTSFELICFDFCCCNSSVGTNRLVKSAFQNILTAIFQIFCVAFFVFKIFNRTFSCRTFSGHQIFNWTSQNKQKFYLALKLEIVSDGILFVIEVLNLTTVLDSSLNDDSTSDAWCWIIAG